jgi:hypothetical protein
LPYDGQLTANNKPIAGTTPTTLNGIDQVLTLLVPTDKITVNTNSGNDVIKLGNTITPATSTRLNLEAGRGFDFMSVTNWTVTAPGEEVLHKLTKNKSTFADSELDNDTVIYRDFIVNAPMLSIYTGGGVDRLHVNTVRIPAGTLFVNAGNGADHIHVYNTAANHLRIIAGVSDDRDSVQIRNYDGAIFDCNLGGGDDFLSITTNIPRSFRNGALNGGLGVDTVTSINGFDSVNGIEVILFP